MKRGVFRAVNVLEKTIARYIAATNKTSTLFVCIAPQTQSGQSSL